LQNPSVPQAAAPLSVHWFSGSWPVGTLVQVPTVPVSAHDWHVPAHAALQQKPCAQNPDRHWVAVAHAAPWAFLVQLPPLQVNGATQSVSAVQVVLQADVPHANGSHAELVAVWQVPVPLQVRVGVNVDPVQAAATQAVPLAYRRQAPAPSQNPSVPQAAAPLSVHWLSGSWPAGTLVQVPTVPVSAHDWQVPVHAALQQKPCAQNPDVHWPAVVQAAPAAFVVQLPPLQLKGETQSASAVQVVLHAAVPQTYGEQGEVATV
jgi:hypothetical protein